MIIISFCRREHCFTNPFWWHFGFSTKIKHKYLSFSSRYQTSDSAEVYNIFQSELCAVFTSWGEPHVGSSLQIDCFGILYNMETCDSRSCIAWHWHAYNYEIVFLSSAANCQPIRGAHCMQRQDKWFHIVTALSHFVFTDKQLWRMSSKVINLSFRVLLAAFIYLSSALYGAIKLTLIWGRSDPRWSLVLHRAAGVLHCVTMAMREYYLWTLTYIGYTYVQGRTEINLV